MKKVVYLEYVSGIKAIGLISISDAIVFAFAIAPDIADSVTFALEIVTAATESQLI